jgi:hypothetical protein
MNSPTSPQSNRRPSDLRFDVRPTANLTVPDIGRMRADLYRSCPQFDHPAMARFVVSCFESDEMVLAYFKPMHMPVLARGNLRTGRTIKAIPFTHALRAAGVARSMSLIEADSELHKKLVFMAALLAPAALFLNTIPKFSYVSRQPKPLNRHLEEIKSSFLLKPLHELSKWDRESATLLAVILGYKTTNKFDLELASRMETALSLSMLSIRIIWRAIY